MSAADAIRAESAGRIEEAAEFYELSLRDHVDLDTLINLIVLYWQVTDPGVAAAQRYPPAFHAKAATRLRYWLGYLSASFPHEPKAKFWKKFIEWADLGAPFSQDECRKMLAGDPDYREPAMFLYMTSQGRECANEAIELYLDTENSETTRSRHIRSIVEPLTSEADEDSTLRSVRIEAARLLRNSRRQ